MVNPFVIDPAAGDRSPVLLQGLGNVIRENRQQKEAKQRQEMAGQALQGALQRGDLASIQSVIAEYPEISQQVVTQFGLANKQTEDAVRMATADLMTETDPAKAAQRLRKAEFDILSKGGKPEFISKAAERLESGDASELDKIKQFAVMAGFAEIPSSSMEKPAGQREFEALISDFSPEQKRDARLIKAGLKGRRVSSALQTIAEEGTAEEVADASAIIKEREKFAEMTGASRSKMIDKAFDRVVKIDKGLQNIDRAINVIESGAGTGALEKFLPSFKAASVALDQIQGELALDVIGAVTFGALSEGELRLAKEIALPSGLDGPDLVAHLKERKAAQEKLRSYFQEQIDHLDQGGTVASFLRMKEREGGDDSSVSSVEPEGQIVSQDQQAIEWARANPNDPRASQILSLQGG